MRIMPLHSPQGPESRDSLLYFSTIVTESEITPS